MKLHFDLEEHEIGYDINNFTVANAIYKACIESRIARYKLQSSLLDAEIIAKMLLLQCEKDGEEE